MSLLLIHGGLWEDMDAGRFWTATGVTGALRDRGIEVHAPDRLRRATSWRDEVAHLEPALGGRPLTVVGASNGCSTAVLLALARPDLVRRLVLAWPATAGDPEVDAAVRRGMARQGADAGTVEGLLAGGALRGVTDARLRALRLPVAVVPAFPNPVHQRRTADALLALIPGARELPATPEPPMPAFPAHLAAFVAALARESEADGGADDVPGSLAES